MDHYVEQCVQSVQGPSPVASEGCQGDAGQLGWMVDVDAGGERRILGREEERGE